MAYELVASERALDMMDALIEVRESPPGRFKKRRFYLFVSGRPVGHVTGVTREQAEEFADGIRVPVAQLLTQVMEGER